MIFGLVYEPPYWPDAPLALIALTVTTRALRAAATGDRLQETILLPISAGLMTIIAIQAL